MRRYSLLILIFFIFSGCTTFTSNQLKEHDAVIFQEGYDKGFLDGRIYECYLRLKKLLKDME